jgi:hypothetical protein
MQPERLRRPTPEQDKRGRFIAGNSGNGGRPRGARNKLGEAFVEALYEQWHTHGRAALERVIEEDPVAFLKLVAGLVPRQVEVTNRLLEQLSDKELGALSDLIEALVAGRPDQTSDAESRGESVTEH